MPQIVAVKFSSQEMPRFYMPGAVAPLRPDEFVVAPRDGEEEMGFVSGIEYRATEHLRLRPTPYPTIVRRATAEEVEEWWDCRALERKAIVMAKERAAALNLPIKITRVRYNPRVQPPRLLFHFSADTRVDFRLLVRELGAIFKVRIELLQLGAREEARLVDGFGICGQQTCCSTFLTEFRPLSIRMAREQDIPLPPTKLTGQCGRLLCCLSYEVDQYRELSRAALPKGATVTVGGKKAIIIDRNLIARTYTLREEGGAISHVSADVLKPDAVDVPEQMRRFGKTLASRSEDTRATESKPPRERDTPPSRAANDTPAGEESEAAEEAPRPASPEPAPRRRARTERPAPAPKPAPPTPPPPSPAPEAAASDDGEGEDEGDASPGEPGKEGQRSGRRRKRRRRG